jgi:4'-phosphopantetheinyl transferase
MTPMWHDGPLDTLDWDGASPVAWSVAQSGPVVAERGGAPPDDLRRTRRQLASALLARLAGLPAERVRLERSDAGAPVVATPRGWHLGLSSRGSICLIGVATTPIAVDRELVEVAPPLWDMLTDSEARDLRQADTATQPREWLRRWTIKEAHAKLVGNPRRIAPEAIETVLADPVHATARFEGVSHCWTRLVGGAIETVAQWIDCSGAPVR